MCIYVCFASDINSTFREISPSWNEKEGEKWRRVAFVRTDVKEELSTSFIRVTIGKLGTKLKNGVFWVVTPCGSCKNRRFGGTWRLLHQGDKNQ
jgi:hypothetical protein